MKSSAINVGIAIGAGFVAVAEAGALKWGFAVDERSYTPAQQTAPGFMIDMASATSPKPTKAPEAARFEIRKRQASQGFDTCGFINGIQG